MLKIKNPRLSEEIQRYSKILPPTKKYPMKLFTSFIPYRGFTIVLGHPLVPSSKDSLFYAYSKYGWWQYGVKKERLDVWEEKLLFSMDHRFGQDRFGHQEEYLWCKDNQQHTKYCYNLHPNGMVADLRREIDIFIEEKNILKKRERMSEKDLKRIEEKAKEFLEITIKQSKGRITPVYIDKGNMVTTKKEERMCKGWIVKGTMNTYFLDENKRVHYFKPGSLKHFQTICIESITRNRFLHDYDHITSRILALLNDKKLKKQLHTIELIR